MRLDPVTTLMAEAFAAIKSDEQCRQVEMRYNSIQEFELCVVMAKWLMHKYQDRGLKVSIIP